MRRAELESDPDEAEKWFKRAANEGVPGAEMIGLFHTEKLRREHASTANDDSQ
jgi:TPR repeat protein